MSFFYSYWGSFLLLIKSGTDFLSDKCLFHLETSRGANQTVMQSIDLNTTCSTGIGLELKACKGWGPPFLATCCRLTLSKRDPSSISERLTTPFHSCSKRMPRNGLMLVWKASGCHAEKEMSPQWRAWMWMSRIIARNKLELACWYFYESISGQL